ncbi:putative ganciclovir kinase, partial [Dissostichus eleginoides]
MAAVRKLRLSKGEESAEPGLCVSCHIQLICQRTGLFLERPELAAQNQAAINLPPQQKDAGGSCEKRRLMGKGAAPLSEQVTKQSGNSLFNLRLS